MVSKQLIVTGLLTISLLSAPCGAGDRNREMDSKSLDREAKRGADQLNDWLSGAIKVFIARKVTNKGICYTVVKDDWDTLQVTRDVNGVYSCSRMDTRAGAEDCPMPVVSTCADDCFLYKALEKQYTESSKAQKK